MAGKNEKGVLSPLPSKCLTQQETDAPKKGRGEVHMNSSFQSEHGGRAQLPRYKKKNRGMTIGVRG